MEQKQRGKGLQWLLLVLLLGIIIGMVIGWLRYQDTVKPEMTSDAVTAEEAVDAIGYLSGAVCNDFVRAMRGKDGMVTVGEIEPLLEQVSGACPVLASSQRAIADVPVTRDGFWQLFVQLSAMQQSEALQLKPDVWTEVIEVYGTSKTASELSGHEVCTSRGMLYDQESALLQQETDHGVLVTGVGNQVLHCWKRTDTTLTYPNVLITQAGEGKLQLFVGGVSRSFSWARADASERELCADVTVQDGTLVQVTEKPEQITEKVLRVTEDGVELADSGWLPFAEDVRFYKGYGSPEMQTAEDVLVGYQFERFTIEDGAVCAAVMTQTFHAENIRVLLRTDGFAGLFHENVQITGLGDYYVFYGRKQEFHSAGEQVSFSVGDPCFTSGRVIVKPVETDAGLRLDSLRREAGVPIYPGTLELNVQEDGITLVNEVRLDTYLERVVPSEVSSAYSMEALKAQAICARTYGWLQIRQNALRRYGAHVDDSENFQVYNNLPESEKTSAAVQETYGQVLSYEGTVVPAYYFSTSWGSTTDPSIWGGQTDSIPYLHPVTVTASGFAKEAGATGATDAPDLREEDVFRQALATEDGDAFEKNCTWFRWSTDATLEQLTESLQTALPERIALDPAHIRVQDVKSGEWLTEEQMETQTDLGMLESMEVLQRVGGGSVQKMKFTGEKQIVIAEGQSNIRRLLGCFDAIYETETGAVQAGRELLQSSFFWLEERKQDGSLTGYRIHGGGKGHGLGMPQNAMRAMGESGYTAEEILGFFYPGTELENVY